MVAGAAPFAVAWRTRNAAEVAVVFADLEVARLLWEEEEGDGLSCGERKGEGECV